MASKLPKDLCLLIELLKKLPGVGTKTSERFSFELLSWPQEELKTLSELLFHLKEKIPFCKVCGCLKDISSCFFCTNRVETSLCIIGSAKDAYAIEQTGQYKGLYHVVEHLLSPLDGRHSDAIDLDRIRKRVQNHRVTELILAFDSTIEADTTALYLKEELSSLDLRISRLAFGLPLGSSLEYIDGGTLAKALLGRQSVG